MKADISFLLFSSCQMALVFLVSQYENIRMTRVVRNSSKDETYAIYTSLTTRGRVCASHG